MNNMFGKKNNKRDGWTLEDYAIEQIDKSLKELNKGLNCLNRNRLRESEMHLEVSKIYKESASSIMGDFSGVRDWIKDLFLGEK